jgi:hypothetical protein
MSNEAKDARERLSNLSGSARRLLDYVAVLEGDARYAVMRHMARASEEDMVVDLREVVDAGVMAVVEGQPNLYKFIDEAALEIVMAEIGETRLPKLRTRANVARQRVLGGSS